MDLAQHLQYIKKLYDIYFVDYVHKVIESNEFWCDCKVPKEDK